ncbi:MAG TPA: LysE family translocator [Gaiellaceae bacterium]|nr:LysE family translocator [Gaiellaceae bacterium]
MAGELAAFLAISVLVIVTPGQDTLLTIRNTILGGRGGGVFTALGVASGQAVWTIATSAGLAALLLASEPAFVAVKLAGAAYLVLLGAQALLAAFGQRGEAVGLRANPRRALPAGAAYRQGVVSNLGNPKMAVFFTSLLPQFTPNAEASFAALLLLGAVFCALTLAWLAGYAVAVARMSGILRRPRVRRALDAVTGALLVAFGLRLAAGER